MKKRIACIILTAAAVTLTWGCGSKGASEENSSKNSLPASSFQTAEELISQAEARSRAEVSSARESSSQEAIQVQGSYECALEGIAEEYRPMLTLQPDGTAFFRANLLAGMGEIFGTYTVRGNAVYVEVTEVGFHGFTGENVSEMVFDIQSDQSLKLTYLVPEEGVGATFSGDVFTRKQDKNGK